MPDTPDYVMFLKLMNLTTSSFDNEALSAIRMANAVLARTNQTWDDLLHNKIVMIAPPQESRPKSGQSNVIKHADASEIDAYFDALSQRNLGTFQEWIDSVHDWWESKGYLTERQYETLKKAAQRRR